MREKILELKAQGKTYKQICDELNVSKGTVSYYCGDGQKEKTNNRTRKRRENNPLVKKVDTFKSKKLKKGVIIFQKRDSSHGGKFYNKENEITFNDKDVINKFGVETICYLSGEKINLLTDKHYNLDHMIPRDRGGDNSLENLGILHEVVNQMKNNLLDEELIEWCIKILRHNGYEVNKIENGEK